MTFVNCNFVTFFSSFLQFCNFSFACKYEIKCCCIKKEQKIKKNNQGNANDLDLSMHGV